MSIFMKLFGFNIYLCERSLFHSFVLTTTLKAQKVGILKYEAMVDMKVESLVSHCLRPHLDE